MRRILTFIVMLVMLSGCATMNGVRVGNREKLIKLSVGMTKQEVLNIMGTGKVTTYQFAGLFTPFTAEEINNPYRSEILQGKNKTFEVLYYYTDVKKMDLAITDDELTPLVFDDGKLIGWGWSFLQDNAQKYEIRIR